jgi:hypothetical protein
MDEFLSEERIAQLLWHERPNDSDVGTSGARPTSDHHGPGSFPGRVPLEARQQAEA